jgi:DNA primase
MDTSPQAQPTPHQIVAQISTLLTQLVSVITSQQQAKQPTHNTEDFKDTVETILENATWFDKQVEDKVEEHFEGYDISAVVRSELDDNVSDHIERYMSHSFDIEDHVNVEEKVRDELSNCLSDEVSEVLDEVLESKVGECLDEMLEDKIAEILSRRTITINF